ncbi:hypothetical protein [Raineyella fluvialis]|uniref:Uncharacterized protein n=1 Tax=Raineyella fluvialis TaxID=2662261 RepID=A0A5Q2FGY3_9ACTN|nr:hypothetical protein [Raineyella fluvialis]QGF24804.1 hypothetical protein Rai3103_15535 [Raineyella fluvialis]
MDPVNIIGTSLLALVGLELAVDSVRTWFQSRDVDPQIRARKAQDRLTGIPSWTLVGRTDPF